MSEYLTSAEFAAIVRAPVETVRYWRHIGTGPDSFKVGRRVLYKREVVETWLEQLANAERDASA